MREIKGTYLFFNGGMERGPLNLVPAVGLFLGGRQATELRDWTLVGLKSDAAVIEGGRVG